MSWVYPVSEAARTTRLGVVAAFAWTGVALLAAGAAATLVVGLSESGVVPWLALGGFVLAMLYQIRQLVRTVTALRTGADIEESQQAGAGMG